MSNNASASTAGISPTATTATNGSATTTNASIAGILPSKANAIATASTATSSKASSPQASTATTNGSATTATTASTTSSPQASTATAAATTAASSTKADATATAAASTPKASSPKTASPKVSATANATANNTEKKAKAKAAEKEKLNQLFKALETNYDINTEMFDIDKIKTFGEYNNAPNIIQLLRELNKSNGYSQAGNEALYKIKRYLSEHKEDDTDEKIKVFKELCTASENLISTAP